MPKCIINECNKLTQFKDTKNIYCMMHLARIKRHGYPELKKERGEHALEKLPHGIVDEFILSKWQIMKDDEIASQLNKMGFKNATVWTVKYRRRKLGKKKYLIGEIKKHKAWVRAQAIKKYGRKCELCEYNMSIDTHHIIPKHKGGPHEINNLMVVCPNCHSLITRKYLVINNRKEIPIVKSRIINIIKSLYAFN